MKLLKLSTCVALALLSGCVTQPPPLASIEFNYKIDNPSASGIVQIFDMNGSTVVQVRNIDIRRPVFLDDDAVEIKHHVVGQTAVLVGIHRSFNVVSGNARSRVTRIGEGGFGVLPTRVERTAGAPGAAQSEVLPQLVASDEELRAELTKLKRELKTLKSQLSGGAAGFGQKGESATTSEAPKVTYAQIASSRSSSSVRIQFRDNSDEIELKPSLAATLMELTKDASEISVVGYTDSPRVSPASTRLARARAAAATKYLASNGVEKKKISMSFKPSGGFIADNTTKEGRDANRRVEIEIL